MAKTKTILVESMPIALLAHLETDFISLTDMVRAGESGSAIIENWLRNKNTLEFLAVWEEMSVKQWISKTNATGMLAKTGSYGGTFAGGHAH